MSEKVVITGGCGGVGLTTIKILMARGASVAILDINEAAGAATIAELNSSGYSGKAYFFQADVTSWESLESAWAKSVDALGSVNVVLPNAGVPTGPTGTLFKGAVKPNLKVFDININGVIFFIQLAVDYLRTQPVAANGIRGKIVITASQCSVYPMPLDPLYGTTKHAVWGFIKGAAPVLSAEGIHLNGVGPGFMDTPFNGMPEYADQMGFKWTPVSTAARGIVEVLDNDKWTGKLLECAADKTALTKPQQYLDEYSKDVWDKTCYNAQMPWAASGAWNEE